MLTGSASRAFFSLCTNCPISENQQQSEILTPNLPLRKIASFCREIGRQLRVESAYGSYIDGYSLLLANILHEVISIDRFWLNNHIKYSLTHERKWIELTGGLEYPKG